MGDFQIKTKPKEYDAVIIGSGAGGGMAAYTLAHAGLKVALLEAGPMYDPAKNVTQLKWPWESPRRGASTKFRNFGDFDAAYWGWQIDGEPYTHADDTEWHWFRGRMLGGRTNHWGRISLRFGPHDFKRRSIDGLGDNWPISYDDIKPYYDKVDRLIGVFGTNEGLENDPDGVFLPPPRPRLHELFVKNAATQAGVRVIPSRLSILTKKINEERGACFFCGQCNRGCQVYADFSSSSVLVKTAVATGNVDVFPNAMAREVLTGPNGLATSVSYVDKNDLQEYQVKGRTVIVAASTCETSRLLLNSKAPRHSNGLANSSGVVGKYLHDSTGASMGGRGEAVPREDNYCEIDPDVVDKYGIPVLRFNVKWSDHEVKQAKHMKETFKEIMHNMGAVITYGDDGPENSYGLEAPGKIIHEAGTARMGDDPKTSALNGWNQAHDCKNLFVVDGAAFTSQADKNITWTILALSMRASEYIVNQMKQRNL
jgi:choline dehydrogenase-like flavoprotein